MKWPGSNPKRCGFRLLAVAAVLLRVEGAIAQTANGSPVDLLSPVFNTHASLPQNNVPGNNLDEALGRAQQLAATKGITSSHGVDIVNIDEPTVGGTPTLVANMYRRLTCSADAIITGHPNTWQFHLSSSRTAVYGDYDVSVDTVLKDSPTAPYIKGSHIVITRPGGTITVGTGSVNQVTYKHEGFPLWEKGTIYLIFLRYVAATGAFLPIDPFSTFTGGPNTWTVTRKAHWQDPLFTFPEGTFEQTIKAWVGSCGN